MSKSDRLFTLVMIFGALYFAIHHDDRVSGLLLLVIFAVMQTRDEVKKIKR